MEKLRFKIIRETERDFETCTRQDELYYSFMARGGLGSPVLNAATIHLHRWRGGDNAGVNGIRGWKMLALVLGKRHAGYFMN